METWTTQDGRVIPVKDLEDGHLLNILRRFPSPAYIGLCLDGAVTRRAENLDDYVTWCEVAEGRAEDLWNALRSEAARRGLLRGQ